MSTVAKSGILDQSAYIDRKKGTILTCANSADIIPSSTLAMSMYFKQEEFGSFPDLYNTPNSSSVSVSSYIKSGPVTKINNDLYFLVFRTGYLQLVQHNGSSTFGTANTIIAATCISASLYEIDGMPGVAYVNSSGNLYYAYYNGTSWITSSILASFVYECSLNYINNSPAIAYNKNAYFYYIQYNKRENVWDTTTTNKHISNIKLTEYESNPCIFSCGNIYRDIDCGYLYVSAIKSDGTLWAWGYNTYGQLGDGTTTQRLSPVQIGSSTWTNVSCGQNHTIAIRSDGTIWAWGNNFNGQLGDSTITQRLSPVQIGSSTWLTVSCGDNHTVAIKSDGTLWSWGGNSTGQLGVGDITQRLTPVQVGYYNLWSSVSCGNGYTIVIDTYGRLNSCGWNTYGQLGDGTTYQRNSLVQIGSSEWSLVSCGYNHTVAIKSDGTLWSWGFNSHGELGDGTTSTRTSPVQIGSSIWITVTCGQYFTTAIQKNQVWAWGYNANGQLGDGTIVNKISPTISDLTLSNNFYSYLYNSVSFDEYLIESDVFNYNLENNDIIYSTYSDDLTYAQFNGSSWDSYLIESLSSIIYNPIIFKYNNNIFTINEYGNLLKQNGIVWEEVVAGITGSYVNISQIDNKIYSLYYLKTYNSLSIKEYNIKENSSTINDVTLLSQGKSSPLTLVDGFPVISYVDDSGYIRCATFDGSSWTDESVYEVVSSSPSLIDNYGNPGIAFVTGTDLKYIEKSGISWNISSVADAIDATQISCSLIYGQPAIAAICGSSLYFFTFNGSSWDISLVDAITSGTSCVLIEYSGDPMIAILDSGTLKTYLYSGSWTATSHGSMTSYDFNMFSYPTLTYTNGTTLYYSYYNGISWISSTVATIAINSLSIIENNNIIITGRDASNIYSYVYNGISWDKRIILNATNDWCFSSIYNDCQIVAFINNSKLRVIYCNPDIYNVKTQIESSTTTNVDFKDINNSKNVSYLLSGNLKFANYGSSWDKETVESSVSILGNLESYNDKPMIAYNGYGRYVKISASETTASFVTESDNILCSGINTYGAFGDGTTTGSSLYSKIPYYNKVIETSVGNNFIINIRQDGTLWSNGLNTSGQLGDGTIVNKTSPVQIGTSEWLKIESGLSHTIAIRSDGTLWSWGLNANGQLGLGDTTTRTSPVKIGVATTWDSISCGDNCSFAIKTDGTLWVWGDNTYGQLGLGDTTQRTSPVQLGILTTWVKVDGSLNHASAVKTDGTLWSWGLNTYGQLGDGTTTQRFAPVQVGVSTIWSDVSCGTSHTLVLRSDNTLWAFGLNSQSQLGDGTTLTRMSPVQIGTAYSFIKAVSTCSFAISKIGKGYSWGTSTNGIITSGVRITPTEIFALTSSVLRVSKLAYKNVTWSYEDVLTSSPLDVSFREINGNKAIATSTNDYKLIYSYYDGSNWIDEVLPYNSKKCILLEINSKPAIVYAYGTTTYTLSMATYDGTSWSTTSIASSINPYLDAITINNKPFVIYHDYSTNVLCCSYYNGTSWSKRYISSVITTNTNFKIGSYNNKPIVTANIEGTNNLFIFNGNIWSRVLLDTIVGYSASGSYSDKLISITAGTGLYCNEFSISNDLTEQSVISKDNSYKLTYKEPFNKFYFTVYQSDTTEKTCEFSLSNDFWNHVMLLADGTNVEVYVNNTLNDQTAYDGTIQNTSTALKVNNSGPTYRLDNFGFWKDIVFTEESYILFKNYLYNNGTPLRFEHLRKHWGSYEVADSTTTLGNFLSLASITNKPAIAYYDSTNRDLKYAIKTGSTWTTSTAVSTGNSGQYCSLTEYASQPWISYYYSDSGDLMCAYYNGAAWVTSTIDASGYVGWYTCIKVIGSYPAISYYDKTNGNLKYAKYNGATWATETVYSTDDSGLYTSLYEVDSQPAIAFYDSTNANLMYTRYNGATWDTEVVYATGEVGAYCSLSAIGTNPCISFFDNTNKNMMYAEWNGASWDISILDTNYNTGEYTSLIVIDSKPIVCYYDRYLQTIIYQRYNGASWIKESFLNDKITSTDNYGLYNSMISLNGYPAIAFKNSTTNRLMYINSTSHIFTY